MAERPAFYVRQGKADSRLYSFEWFPGFSVSQKQRSVESLHRAILAADGEARPLEVSTRSREPIGVKLSAFRLRLNGYTLENVFQSAKVFEKGGPYSDLLEVPPKEAKRDERLRTSGPLTGFCCQEGEFPLIPRTVFYDYIYVSSVRQSLSWDEISAVAEYNYFTDIEFNPAKSVNTQAGAVSIIKLMLEEYGRLPDFSGEEFIRWHREHVVYGQSLGIPASGRAKRQEM